jgi:hypothetical protein
MARLAKCESNTRLSDNDPYRNQNLLSPYHRSLYHNSTGYSSGYKRRTHAMKYLLIIILMSSIGYCIYRLVF